MRPKHHFVFRVVTLCLGLMLLTFLKVEVVNEARSNLTEELKIKYTVVSQRWLTHEEIRKFEDVIGYRIAIRVRLINNSDENVEYLSSSIHSRPLGYRWDRKIGTKNWSFSPPSRGREGPPGSEFIGRYVWRVLPPHSSVEGEVLSYTARDQEFAFSTFIRKHSESEMREVVSQVIHPLVDR